MEADTWKYIEGWPDYQISSSGDVRKVSSGHILTQWNGKVRLARNRKDRHFLTVSILKRRAFGEPYVPPEVVDLSEPGEIWKRVMWDYGYMISSHGRVWSWKTLQFVGGRRDKNGKPSVLFSDGKSMNIDKIFAMHFGYKPPRLQGEEWRESVSPGIWVSSLGRLFSTCRLCLLNPQRRPNGYLFIEGRDRRWPVHRLVALAFVGGRDLFRNHIDHINENKEDNRACNLRWCTADENNAFYAANHPQGGVRASLSSAYNHSPDLAPAKSES